MFSLIKRPIIDGIPIIIWALLNLTINNVHGFNFECSLQNSEHFILGSGVTCFAQNVVVTDPSQTVTTINDQTAESFRALNIKSISTVAQTINFIPSGLEKFFPNLEGLRLSTSKLKAIDRCDLEPFKGLRSLDLQQNQLEFLFDDLFEYNPELEFINLGANKLQLIGSRVLEHLPKLREVYLGASNGCSDMNAVNPSQLLLLNDLLKTNCKSIREFQRKTCVSNFVHVTTPETPDGYIPTSTGNPADIYETPPPYVPTSTMSYIDEMTLEIENLKSQLSAMQAKCKLETDELNVKIQELQAKPVDEKSLASQLSSLKTKQQSCDGNLDAVLSNLARSNDDIFKSSESLVVDLSCKTDVKDQCTVIDLKIKFSDAVIGIIKDKNGKPMDVANIKALAILGQQTLFLPTNLAKLFPLLKTLTATDSGLFAIDSATLRGLENLTSLILKSNKLMKIAADALKGMKNLIKLDMSFNKITVLPDSVFNDLANLLDLILNDNLLNVISSKLLEGLLNLKNLQLQNNKLKSISPSLFMKLAKLTIADLTNNVCISMAHPKQTKLLIEKAILDRCIEPVEIICDLNTDVIQLDYRGTVDGFKCNVQNLTVESLNTKIANVKSSFVTEVTFAQVNGFVARNQDIKFLPLDLAGSFVNLLKLVVEHSRLISIQKQDLRNLTQLQLLSLSSNNLTSIGEGAFDDVIKLEYLNLAENQITTLPSKIFAKLVQLKFLFLSDNRLAHLSADILPRKNSIEELWVRNNKLNMIQTKIFRYLRAAKWLDFIGNECVNMLFNAGNVVEGIILAQLVAEVDFSCSWDETCR